MDRKLVAVRLTATGRERLLRLANHYGISQAAAVELGLIALENLLGSGNAPPATAPAQPDAAAGAGAGTEGSEG